MQIDSPILQSGRKGGTLPVDPIYLRDFHIKTPITYVSSVVMDPKITSAFQKDWKKFHKKNRTILSKTREKALKRFMKKVQETSSDQFTRNWVSIRYINRSMGHGVFAKKPLPPYKTLIDYTGWFTADQKVVENSDSTFTFTDFPKYAIDGAKMGNWARFMNHADEDDPRRNVIPWELYLPEGPRIVFTTGSRGVKKGEELLYSYGDLYWE
ncbi:MAG: SET domain-containing protein-lysine N-methyltransferase [Chlamydiota bacterium]